MRSIRSFWVFILCLGFVVALVPSLAADETEVIAIRKAYDAIENGEGWVKKVIEIPGEKEAELKITRYETSDGVLKKLVAKSLDDSGRGTERYYYSEGRVFFLFQETVYENIVWEMDENGEQRSTGATEQGALERRFYYAKGKCVRYLLKEAVGADEQEAAAALAKSKNKVSNDPEMAQVYQNRGVMLAGITSVEKLKALLGR